MSAAKQHRRGGDPGYSARRIIALTVEWRRGRTITSEFIRERFGVSPATAKRDMRRLRNALHSQSVSREWRV